MITVYGEVLLKEKRWRFTGEPHVLMQLKRVFGRIWEGEHGTVTIQDTDEIRKRIKWFLLEYPMKVSAGDERLLAEGAARHQATILRLDQIIDKSYVSRAYKMALPPRDYQKVAAEMVLERKGLLIADDLGTGKTVSGLSILTEKSALPAVVVTIAGTMPEQWRNQTWRFLPDLHTHVIEKKAPYALPKRNGQGPDVVISTYHKLGGWTEVLSKYAKTIIFDEVQELRRRKSEKYSAAEYIAHQMAFRCGLSGTPIFNMGGEIWNIVNVLMPDALGTWEEFVREWCLGERANDNRAPAVTDPKALGSYLKSQHLMLRRTRKDVGRELPAVTKIIQNVDSDQKAFAEIENRVAALAKIILTTEKMDSFERMRAHEEFDNKLRQATGISKSPYVADFIRMIVTANEEPVVVFAWHRACFARGTPVLMYGGTLKSVEDVSEGELVMGPDSRPRRVQHLIRGTGRMYRIKPNKGEAWVCNEDHLLSLYYSGGGKKYARVVTMSVADFLRLGPRSRQCHYLYRADTVHFHEESDKPEPWLLGYWLGDGDSNLKMVTIASADQEVEKEAEKIATKYSLRLRKYKQKQGATKCHLYRFSGRMGNKDNPLLRLFRSLNLHQNKHIPHAYLTASPDTRRELLAGLLDSDGHVYQRTGAGTAEISSVYPKLVADIAFLCRSLGFSVTVQTVARKSGYSSNSGGRLEIHRIFISGNLAAIPTRIGRKKAPKRINRKCVLRSGFTVEPIGTSDFYGFQVDGDHLFLLGDFTVVHNCYDILLSKLKDLKPVMFTGSETAAQKKESFDKFVNGETNVLLMSLRAGQGLDGLQKRCRTCIFAELDWTPAVMEQDIGRIDRDGQPDPVTAYFLVSESGSDPVISEALGLKTSQLIGIRDPDQGVIAALQTDKGRIKELAKRYLEKDQKHAKADA